MSDNDSINELNLKHLLGLSNQLNQSIRQLEQSRQQLIFDHHYELIQSSDKITGMKKALEDLTPTTTNLEHRLELIMRVQDTTKLKQSVLLEQIVKLPQLLEYLVREGRTDEAHAVYNKQAHNIDRLLTAQVNGIDRINSACIKIISS